MPGPSVVLGVLMRLCPFRKEVPGLEARLTVKDYRAERGGVNFGVRTGREHNPQSDAHLEPLRGTSGEPGGNALGFPIPAPGPRPRGLTEPARSPIFDLGQGRLSV